MTGFNLPEAVFRSVRPRVVAPQKTLPTEKPAIPAPPTFKTMASKTLRKFAAPSTNNVAIGPQVNIGGMDFNLKSSLITMTPASPFCGKPNEDANAHLQQFLEICSTYTIKGIRDESIPKAWEQLQEYVAACPHHGMDDWLILQNFYNGLTPVSHDHLDTVARRAFLSKTVQGAIELIEKIVSNMGWSEERLQYALSKKLAANDKILENINVKLDGFTSAFQNQLSFNQMIETQLAQLASLVPANDTGRIPGQPNSSVENVKAITTRGGKSTRDPPYPNPVGTNGISKEAPSNDSANKEVQLEKTVPQEYCDTRLLSFPQRSRKPSMDEQFARFVEVIQKIHINVPLLDATQVPTYARYLKDILNNKKPLPTTDVVKLTEKCSNLILHKLPEKKKDPGCPTITSSIGAQQFDQALCDLRASVSVMPKDVFDKLNFTVLAPTLMRLHLADSSVRYPAGIAEDVPIKIQDFFIPVDFVVLDMDTGKETPLILERPFLSTVGANIDVGTGSIRFHINGKEEKFEFQPRTEQCSMVRIKYGPNP
ncbi:uncharacterized protein [Oryza sativa Japonica Group]|uniref:uncharacterized protein n=1 Tax=Oryza sativa subsp. japonica TaxID=39947 RepID=UPI00339BD9AB